MANQVALDFVAGLWAAGIPAAHYLTLWRRDNRRSEWFDDVFDLADRADELAPHADIYLGGATAIGPPRAGRVSQRERKANGEPGNPAQAVPGLWLDLDYEHVKHKKPGLPTRDACEAAIAAADPAPTYVVHSGHGFQLWWALDEPWLLETDGDRAEAEEQMVCIRNYLSTLVDGASIDSVHDVSRVMRLPGTFNHGSSPPVPVTVIKDDGPRYSLQWLLEWSRDHALAIPVASSSTRGERQTPAPQVSGAAAGESERYFPAASAPFPEAKHEVLMGLHSTYAATWNHQRSDLRDRSPSGYEMALVTIAAHAEWTTTN